MGKDALSEIKCPECDAEVVISKGWANWERENRNTRWG